MLFGRVVKWLVSASLMILGLFCLVLSSDEGNIQPIIVTIFSFGAVYILYRSTADIPKPIGFLTVFVLIVSAAAAMYLPVDLPVLNADNFYQSWWGWTMLLGLPIMTLGFIKFKS